MIDLPNISNNKYHYQLTDDYHIYHVEKKRNLKESITKKGYIRVNLNTLGTTPLHRIIALSLIPNPNKLFIVDHIDRNRQNNKIENLRWVTSSENVKNSKTRCTNKLGEKHIHYNKSNKNYVINITTLGIEEYSHSCKTIEEAIKCRDLYLNNNIKTITIPETNTKEKYIINRGNKYRIDIAKKGYPRYQKSVNSLEEAIKLRDEYINSIIY